MPRMSIHRTVCLTLLSGVAALLVTINAWAYPDYSGCEQCHGPFNSGTYTSLHDNTEWGSSLMDAHRTWIGDNCLACHLTNGPGDVFTNVSGDAVYNKSCAGCHGRDEDVHGNCTGLSASLGGREVDCGTGSGLRAMHELNVGSGTCTGCHTNDQTPAAESVAPYNYPWAGTAVADACNADGSEARFGATGLDNDGDGVRDADDPDCQAFRITAGLNDAWFYPLTAGQGFLITVFEETGLVFLAWFTYDVERPPEDVTAILGEPGHRWITAQGPFEGDTATLEIFVSSGGIFDSAEPPVTSEKKGTMVIQWADCRNGVLEYDIEGVGQGMIPIERIALDNVPLCEALLNPAVSGESATRSMD